MSNVVTSEAKQEIKEFEQTKEYLDLIPTTQTIATDAVNTYIEHFSNLDPNQKIQVKWASGLKVGAVTATVTFVQENDKYRAVAEIGGSIIGGAASATITSALVAFAAGLGATSKLKP